jgi:PleD family two-component response regulator
LGIYIEKLDIDFGECVIEYLTRSIDKRKRNNGHFFTCTRYSHSHCIEDSPASAELVRQLIARRSGLKLITAINGRSSIELANSMQPDLILLDSHLPDIDGMEVLKILLGSVQTQAFQLLPRHQMPFRNKSRKVCKLAFMRI